MRLVGTRLLVCLHPCNPGGAGVWGWLTSLELACQETPGCVCVCWCGGVIVCVCVCVLVWGCYGVCVCLYVCTINTAYKTKQRYEI